MRFVFLFAAIEFPAYGFILSLANKKMLAAFILAAIHLGFYVASVIASGWGYF